MQENGWRKWVEKHTLFLILLAIFCGALAFLTKNNLFWIPLGIILYISFFVWGSKWSNTTTKEEIPEEKKGEPEEEKSEAI